jgi:hypothetical protein
MIDQQVSGEGTDVAEGPHTENASGGLPTERLAHEAQNFLNAFAEKALASISDKLSETTGRLVEYVEHGGPGVKSALAGATSLAEGKSPLRAAMSAGVTGLKEKVKQLFKGGGGGKKALKLTNIVEQQDVGVPIRLAYNQWTQFGDFPSFMKKVESAEQESEEKVNWKAQIWWSHRSWQSTIVEQVPDDHIVWRSKGPKGYVDGAVSFSELAPNLTRILLVMEYHPQGLFEHTGNLWRAQGRRARLEFKHYRRHVMAHAILHPEEIEGWRGEIRDGEVVKTHEEALDEEERARKQKEGPGEPEARGAPKEEAPEEEPRVAREEEEEGAAEEEPGVSRQDEEPAEAEREPDREGDEVLAEEEGPAEAVAEYEEPEELGAEAEEPREEQRRPPEARRRRPPAPRRAPTRRSEDAYEDAYEDEAEVAPETARRRPPPRRRSDVR